MSGLLPSSSEPEPPDGEPRVIGVDDAEAEDVLSALSTDTARSLFAAVHDQPATPSELAERTDTSLQNAQYHLEKLEGADLIEPVDTRYSEKGREMQVFGPTGAPVVLFAGGEDAGTDVKSALANLLGGVAVLGIASLLVQRLATGAFFGLGDEAVQVSTYSVETTATSAAGAAGSGLPPGLLFFFGGALVLSLVAVWWYASAAS